MARNGHGNDGLQRGSAPVCLRSESHVILSLLHDPTCLLGALKLALR